MKWAKQLGNSSSAEDKKPVKACWRQSMLKLNPAHDFLLLMTYSLTSPPEFFGRQRLPAAILDCLRDGSPLLCQADAESPRWKPPPPPFASGPTDTSRGTQQRSKLKVRSKH